MLVHNSSKRSSRGEEKEDHRWTPQTLTRDGAMCKRKQIIKTRIREMVIKNVLVATSDGSVASVITRVYRSCDLSIGFEFPRRSSQSEPGNLLYFGTDQFVSL